MASVKVGLYLIFCVVFFLSYQYLFDSLESYLWVLIGYFLIAPALFVSFLNMFTCVFYNFDFNKINYIRWLCLWPFEPIKHENLKLWGVLSLLAALSVLVPFYGLTIVLDLKKEEASLLHDIKETELKMQELEAKILSSGEK